jgi:hypothetical protein
VRVGARERGGGGLSALQCHDGFGARALLESVRCIISSNLHLACTWNARSVEPGTSELTFLIFWSVC